MAHITIYHFNSRDHRSNTTHIFLCTLIFIATLFTIAKKWKQSKCPTTEQWINKMWYIYTMEYYSAIKKNKAMFFAAVKKAQNNAICYLDSTRGDHRKSIRKRKTNTMWYHLLFVEPKIWHKVTYLWNRNRIRDAEHKLVVVKGEGLDGGMEWESGISRCKLAYTGWMNNKVLWHSTGNYIQIPVINHNRKENMKKDVCIYI